jgi:predicted nucleotidyltransferase
MRLEDEVELSMDHHGISFPKEIIAKFCRRHRIRRLALFGSVLGEDFRPDSDVDVLVEFAPGHTAGLLRMAGLEMELSEVLGRKVDLRTPAELSRYFRDEVVRTSEVQYAQE